MLSIRLFGSLQITADGRNVEALHTRKCEALFAMLALRRGHPFSRGQIVGEMWGDFPEERARKCLSSELWRLKRSLRSAKIAPQDFFHCSDRSITFAERSPHWIDVFAFQEGLETARDLAPSELSPDDAASIAEALELYRGDLMQDVRLDYFMVLREALRAEYIRAMECLMQYHTFHARLDEAIVCGQKLVALDPLLEQIHQELILCQFRAGNRAAALRQYAVCEQVLWDELHIEPMPATREIYQRLIVDDAPRAARPAPDRRDRLGSALQHLEAATADVCAARAERPRA